jgi:diguanylate cyclase (GGDEF)-like protein
MKLRNKILIGIGLVWILFLALTYIGSNFFLIRSFLTLERDRADRDLGRVDQALDQIDYSLYTYTSDWTHWNDLYDFMQGKNPSFVPNNLNMTAFVNSTINLMTYWDKKGNLVVGTAVDTDVPQYVAYPLGLEKYIFPGSLLLDRKDVKKDIRGYVLTNKGIMMVAAAAITDGDKVQPPLGASVFGRLLSTQIIQKIEEATKLNLHLYLINQIKNDPRLTVPFDDIIKNKNGHYNAPINENTLQGYTLIKDINEQPIGLFQMTSPRLIYMTGLRAVHYYLISFVILGILVSGLMLWLLRILIIKRLERLDHDVSEISEKNELSRRVDESGKDELSSVSKRINHMMGIIEASHLKLEHRVEERTQELQKTNIQLQEEISVRKTVEEELIIHKEHLVRLAHYDNLTSLPNRVFFNEMLNKSLKQARRHKKTLALLFIDLDRFKNINDALGHPIGDLVLKEIANRFSTVLRSGDILARLGGDEFILLLNDIDHPKFASPVAEKLLQLCARPIKVGVYEFFLTTSIGICIFPGDGESLEDLLKNADMAMYKAKRSGGGVFQYYTKEMDIQAHEHIKLEASLRKAIKQNEFVLYYQPKLNLSDGSMMGVEALIRWESPEVGMVSPAKFIPLAEETGLIMQIGEWALRQACKTNKSWQDQGYKPISMAVNLSPKQFRHQNIAELVKTVLSETKLAPEYLELEITETAVMDNVEAAIHRLNDIQQMGVKITIDDFGTGYTSISYLKQFPVSVLKIDQSFIKGVPDNQNDAAITTAVIALAHSLNMKVVAEGVETPEQLQYLADHDCDMVQGYYLSRPLPEPKILLQLTKVDSPSMETSV